MFRWFSRKLSEKPFETAFLSDWRFQLWTIVAIAIALVIALPILFVLGSIFFDASEVWQHLATTVLPRYVRNSVILMVGVGLGVVTIGAGAAWLVTACRFPGVRMFEWALLLPMAAPAYVLAYTYTDFLEFSGPVQSLLRDWFNWEYGDYWFPNIRSLGGAIALLTLTLYPYVYMLARVAFLEQSVCTLEASRVLGCNPWRSFFTVALPLARPAIAAGTALALMETLNDFGTVQYFGVDTFTTGIYRTWFAMGERIAATQLAAFLLLFVFALLLLERRSRRQAAYYQTSASFQHPPRFELWGFRAMGASLACSLPVIFGFIVPGGVLLVLAIAKSDETFGDRFWEFARHSLFLASVTAVIGAIVALVLAYGVRLNPSPWMRLALRVSALGYAIPGSAIAVGVLVPVGNLDNTIDRWMRSTFNVSTGLLLSGTVTILIFAYLVRFLAVSLSSVESSLGKIAPSLDEASRSLGYTPLSTLLDVHVPMMWGGLLTATMMVFVDVMKELPATMVIRPFNFDTLAVRVYNLASDERLAEASGPALALVGVGIVPVIFLSWRIARSRS
ncbi:ABC transporter permease [Baaleninema simplex]|uniref:ABC transporter permease n=1 Tax=Baaleninema simplex TaxID=2862350 RepID=UPI00034CA055|nr:iron ABC transporter permease [Baaleninema simplex]